MKKILAIDIGGTAIKYGILDENGTLLEEKKTETEAMKGAAHLVEKVCTLISQTKNDHELAGVTISTAGIVDVEKGEIVWANDNLPGYTGTKWKQILESRFQIPCEVENDGFCAGLAEYYSGSLQGTKVGLCLVIGTGIGGALVVDGNIFHGANFAATEIGYLILPQGGFEATGSTKALVESVAARKGIPPSQTNGYEILQQAKAGEEVSANAISEMCDILGAGIANICYVANPEVIVIGGGISAQKEYLYPKIRAALDKYLMKSVAENTKLTFAVHENLAGLLGAFYNFRKRQGWT